MLQNFFLDACKTIERTGRCLRKWSIKPQLTANELTDHAPFPAIDRPALGGWWEGAHGGRRTLGAVGDAECRLCGIKEYVDACMVEVLANPWPCLLRLESLGTFLLRFTSVLPIKFPERLPELIVGAQVPASGRGGARTQ